MKKVIGLLFFIIVTASAVSAQNYDWSLGVRLGGTSGIAGKFALPSGNAVEGILSWNMFEDDTVMLTGLYEWIVPVINDDFNFYYGVGAHLGTWNKDFAFGADVIVGLEYKIPSAPIAFSVDWMPGLNFTPDVGFFGNSFALTVKYCF